MGAAEGDVEQGESTALVQLPLAAEFAGEHGVVSAIALDDSAQHLFSADEEVSPDYVIWPEYVAICS